MASGNLELVLRHLCRLASDADDAELTDAQLLERYCRQQEENAFTLLLQRYAALVWGVCRRVLHNVHDAEDAFQATFLILARKASSISKPEGLASWLHEVALRTALRTRGQVVQRRLHEGQARTMAQQDWIETVAWRDLQPVLDEEVQRLPKTYREPFVLCYLEGKTYQEAGDQLGCQPGTISAHLAKARELLRQRLTNRGLTLPVGLLGAVLTHCTSTAVPAALLSQTNRAVLSQLAAPATSAEVSAQVAALAEEGVQAMSVSKSKIIAGMLLLGALIGSGLLLAHQASAMKADGETPTVTTTSAIPDVQPKPEQTSRAKPKPVAPIKSTPKPRETMTITGKVYDATGKAAAGAWVAVLDRPKPMQRLSFARRETKLVKQVQTDKDGMYTLIVPYATEDESFGRAVVAWSKGHAPVQMRLRWETKKQRAHLWLIKDRPLRGRIVDLQGEAVAGVAVHIVELEGQTTFIQGRFRQQLYDPITNLKAWPRPVVTDANGRFTLHGVGPDWMAKVHTGNKRLAMQRLTINPSPQMKDRLAQSNSIGNGQLYVVPNWKNKSEQFTWAALPARTVMGTIQYGDTGKPVPHAKLIVYVGGQNASFLHEDKMTARADAKGKYSMQPKFGNHFTIIVYPEPGTPYFQNVSRFVWKQSAAVKKTLDITLRAAILVSGTVTEADTGKPIVKATVDYFPAKKNPHYHRDVSPGLLHLKQIGLTDEQGRYSVPVLPGEGYLLINTKSPEYIRAKISPVKLRTRTIYRQRLYPQGLVKLDLAENVKQHTTEIKLRRGLTVRGRFVDPQGQPVFSAVAAWRSHVPLGYTLENLRPLKFQDDTFTLHGVDPQNPQTVYFYQSSKKLGAVVTLPKRAKKPLAVKMMPCGSVKVRLQDENGKLNKKLMPHAELILTPGASRYRFDPNKVAADAVPMRALDQRPSLFHAPDEQGYYTISGLIPEAPYGLYGQSKERFLYAIDKNFTVRSGQTLDLGTVIVKSNN